MCKTSEYPIYLTLERLEWVLGSIPMLVQKKIQRHHLPKGKGFEAADDRMTSESIESIGPGELTLEKRGDTEVNGKQILQLGRPKQDDLAYLIRTYLGR